MVAKGVGVLGSADWSGLGSEAVDSGPGVSHCVGPSGFGGRWLVGSFCLHESGAETRLRSRC